MGEKEKAPPEKLSKRNLWGYALGAIPAGLYSYIFSLKYIELFYDDLRLLPMYFIIGQVIYMTINALNDPLSGQLTDRTNREKWGSRRLIYIKYGAPIWAFTFILIWFPWSFDNQFIIFLHYVISICLFDTMLTLVVLCWMALLPEMTSNIDERNKTNFLALVLGAVAVVPILIIIGVMEPLSLAFQILVILIAIISTIFLLIVAKLCEEKPEFLNDETFPLWKSIKETTKSKSYLLFIGYNFCGVLIGSLTLSYLFVYVLILGADSAMTSLMFILIFVFVGYISYVVCIFLRPKWGMRKVILRFGVLRVIGIVATFIFILDSSFVFLLWAGFIWMTFFGGYGVYTTGGLMYLSVDEDELKHGNRREGMFLGINALFTKPAGSLGPIFATLILVYFGYIQGSKSQPDSALLGIKILFLIVPAIFIAISLIFMYFYPLHGDYLEDMRAKLEELHKTKREKIQ